MTRPAFEMADIVRRKGRQFLQRFKAILSYQQLKAYRAIQRCRTAALGGHKDKCEDCPYEAPISYNSCRSRSCPKCQAQARKRWLEAQRQDLLNTNYFHVVFTVPHELNPLALTSRRPFLDLLFDASSQTLLHVARDPRRLAADDRVPLHPAHVEFQPAAPLSCPSRRSRWRTIGRSSALDPHQPSAVPAACPRPAPRLPHEIPRRSLPAPSQGPAAQFRDPAWFQRLIKKLSNKKWYVYAKPLFGGPEHVLRYLGRYTHRMAISNHRLTAFDGERVSFRWRDYAHGGKQRVMTLDAVNFLCRFFLHVLPKGFVRIRRYGLLSNRFRKQLLPLARTLLAAQQRQPLPLPPLPDCAPWHCPRCGKAMRVVERFTAAELYFA